MTRQKQIEVQAKKFVEEYAKQAGLEVETANILKNWYKLGAEWADKTMIDKVCEWLCMNMTSIEYFGINGNIIKPDFIQRFKKAMEGE